MARRLTARFLVDTNVWLERLLDQERSEEVRLFLDTLPSNQLFITDFSFHSIGVILCRLGRSDVLTRFVQDVFMDGAVGLVSLWPEDMGRGVETVRKYRLDFDDAYQYVASEKHRLRLVSFDDDFDGTEHGRVTPHEAVQSG